MNPSLVNGGQSTKSRETKGGEIEGLGTEEQNEGVRRLRRMLGATEMAAVNATSEGDQGARLDVGFFTCACCWP